MIAPGTGGYVKPEGEEEKKPEESPEDESLVGPLDPEKTTALGKFLSMDGAPGTGQWLKKGEKKEIPEEEVHTWFKELTGANKDKDNGSPENLLIKEDEVEI